jgi:broad specificity phosphatase PhoE
VISKDEQRPNESIMIQKRSQQQQHKKLQRQQSALDLDRDVDLHCLADLPPIPSDSIRIYLCRHGQTENNRLRKVQGARVDPPINDNGRVQATNLGKAIALAGYRYVSSYSSSSSAIGTTKEEKLLTIQGNRDDKQSNNQVEQPNLIFSSNLQRAQMTAELVEREISTAFSSSLKVRQLPALGEIDFGPVTDGKPINEVQQRMTQAYALWSIGQLDYHPDGGGESGREVCKNHRKCLKSRLGLSDWRTAWMDGLLRVVQFFHFP